MGVPTPHGAAWTWIATNCGLFLPHGSLALLFPASKRMGVFRAIKALFLQGELMRRKPLWQVKKNPKKGNKP